MSVGMVAVKPTITVVDHHRPGDPGYGKPPEEFWGGSSIGQVLELLKTGFDWRCAEYDQRTGWLFTAAADHCLESAYRGRCPGVDPEDLMRWRAESRAAFQKRPVEDVMADVESARFELCKASGHTRPCCGGTWETYHCPLCDGSDAEYHRDFADLRGRQIPELPEAAAREGIPFLATVKDRDGREKVVMQAAPPELIERFLAGNVVPGLNGHERYGDPARGIAGIYL
jgi:hypothetical protein